MDFLDLVFLQSLCHFTRQLDLGKMIGFQSGKTRIVRVEFFGQLLQLFLHLIDMEFRERIVVIQANERIADFFEHFLAFLALENILLDFILFCSRRRTPLIPWRHITGKGIYIPQDEQQ